MTAAVIIPARLGSTRFPGKPLQMIGRRPLIEWTWLAAKRTGLPVWIATDDTDIEAVSKNFGADVVMTGDCANGTERCMQAVDLLFMNYEIIVNWQGDSPLCPPAYATSLIEELLENEAADVATPVMMADALMARHLKADRAVGMIGATTAVLADNGRALYFSKAVLPPSGPHWLHVGMYAYRMKALEGYGTVPCSIERIEGLEQLRFIDHGIAIWGVRVETRPIWEVNNPGDVQLVADLLQAGDASD